MSQSNKKKLCLWCNSELPKGRRKYCSDDCSDEYFTHRIGPLWWRNAVQMALERAGNKCEDCGSVDKLEVHHKELLEPWEQRHNSYKNSQDNLKVLCRACHERVHHGIKIIRAIPKEQLAFNL